MRQSMNSSLHGVSDQKQKGNFGVNYIFNACIYFLQTTHAHWTALLTDPTLLKQSHSSNVSLHVQMHICQRNTKEKVLPQVICPVLPGTSSCRGCFCWGQQQAQQLAHNEAFRRLFSHHVAPAPVCFHQMFHVFTPKSLAAAKWWR